MNVKSIVIVGGGSSGWMTAAALNKRCPHIKTTLVESKNIPTIGVGESTLAHINEYFDLLELNDEDWMPHCNATYKVSIQFTDFKEKGTVFQYPFGHAPGWLDEPHSIQDFMVLSALNDDVNVEDFAYYFNTTSYLAKYNRLTENKNLEYPNYNFQSTKAYHFNADLFGKYLKENCSYNIKHITDDVIDVVLDEEGAVDKLILDENGELKADLYIDCTGFKSLLIDKVGVNFQSYSDILLNDRAVAGRVPYKDRDNEMVNVTDCKGLSSGWRWTTPLWDVIGSGYVYSSYFLSEEEAETEFRESWGDRGKDLEVRHLKIKHGKHEKPWEKNVIAIGLSFGFIEPLESTGLLSTHHNVTTLIDILQSRKNINKIDVQGYNHSCNSIFDNFSKFVALHYGLSSRRDTPYWRYVTEQVDYAEHYLDDSIIDNDLSRQFMNSTYSTRFYDYNNLGATLFIATGMGYNPISKRYAEHLVYNIHKSQGWYDMIKSKWHDVNATIITDALKCPKHIDFLREKIYKE